MDHGDVDGAVAEMTRVLRPAQDRDRAVRAGPLEWTCRETAAHVAHDLTAYAGQIAGREPSAYLPFDLVVRPEATAREVLDVVVACGALLSAALRVAGPETRGWHWGPTDTTGFAALGVDETLVHTWDIVQGLGLDWAPPPRMCARVLARLFPGAPSGDPVQVLLRCTGRAALPDRPRRPPSWKLRAALG
ncbi:maleylpyruvate isomerase N-terminal domain-containing protein [Actinoplanes sp. NPDC049802]|uniref:maleylpyruvate isomerase N-terminal domain-containing protein n=1 Tax=Actinoplanes sp. NPDC049802 TaxID=3154742 RepID=UPI0033EAD1C3